jgi:hypothetical protein
MDGDGGRRMVMKGEGERWRAMEGDGDQRLEAADGGAIVLVLVLLLVLFSVLFFFFSLSFSIDVFANPVFAVTDVMQRSSSLF